MARGHVYRRRRQDGRFGRWNAVIDEPRAKDEPRKQITRTFSTEREARRWLAMKVAALEEQTARGPILTMSAYLTSWLDALAHVRVSTLASYRSHVDKHLIPNLGDRALADVKPADVQRLVQRLQGSGLTDATTHRVLSTLSSAMKVALRDGLIVSNPVVGVDLPSAFSRPLPSWTLTQARTFLARLGDGDLDACLRLALVTGLRRGELLGLRWVDLDLPGGLLHVRRSRVAVGGRVVEGPPKSASGVRSVYLDQETVAVLRRMRARARSRGGGDSDALVFTEAQGEPWNPWWLSRQFDSRVSKMGLPAIRFHDLRHISATLGLASGETLREISSRLGHADISTTANLYTEVVPALAQASAQRRERFIAGSKSQDKERHLIAVS